MPPAENSEITPEYNLPPPVNETGESVDNSPEKAISSPELSKNPKSPKASSPKTPLADFQLAGGIATPPTTVASSTSVTDNPQIADDNDLIEKEWVSKAKKIIEENREDPYIQSKEMTLFKADYMKKRYNKAIKVSE
jgi:hypothetical protein